MKKAVFAVLAILALGIAVFAVTEGPAVIAAKERRSFQKARIRGLMEEVQKGVSTLEDLESGVDSLEKSNRRIKAILHELAERVARKEKERESEPQDSVSAASRRSMEELERDLVAIQAMFDSLDQKQAQRDRLLREIYAQDDSIRQMEDLLNEEKRTGEDLLNAQNQK